MMYASNMPNLLISLARKWLNLFCPRRCSPFQSTNNTTRENDLLVCSRAHIMRASQCVRHKSNDSSENSLRRTYSYTCHWVIQSAIRQSFCSIAIHAQCGDITSGTKRTMTSTLKQEYKTVTYPILFDDETEEGTLLLFGRPTASRILFMCAGFPDNHSCLISLARRFALAGKHAALHWPETLLASRVCQDCVRFEN